MYSMGSYKIAHQFSVIYTSAGGFVASMKSSVRQL